MANKAIIGVESHETMMRRALDIARRVDRGERVAEADYHLNFATAAQMFAELTPARLALLEALKKTGPQSIYALARRLNRNYSNVHRDVGKLMEHELIARDEKNRVFVPWEDVLIRVSLRSAA
jgi:predicted transcriptional regulator